MQASRVMFLEGKRLYLRPVEKEDLSRCQRWVNDPDARRFVLSNWPMDAVAEEEWFDKLNRGVPRTRIALAIVLKERHRHIGVISLDGIDWRNRSATTGMVIGEAGCRSKGYGHEAKVLLLEYAFLTLGLHRINSTVLASNPRSLACLKKSGYVEEGCRRKSLFVGGEWVDEIVLGLLVEDWLVLRPL